MSCWLLVKTGITTLLGRKKRGSVQQNLFKKIKENVSTETEKICIESVI